MDQAKNKRDIDLIRLLLLDIEGKETVDLSEYSAEQIDYHTYLLNDSGFVKDGFITQAGEDVLSDIRNEVVWKMVKSSLSEKGIKSVSFAVLRAMLQKTLLEMEITR